MKKFVSGIIMIFLYTQLIAQTDPANPLPQFLFQKFSKGIVKMKAGNKYAANMNYNMIDEEMLFEQKGLYMVLDKPQDIDTVFLQNRIFVPVGKAFYEVLSDGKITLFIQHKSKYAPAGTNTAYGLKSQTNSSFSVGTVKGANSFRTLDVPENVTVSVSSQNWVRKSGSMTKFANERQFLKIFPEKEAELRKFIKENRINFKTREDLIKIGLYCNEIVK